MYRRKIAKTKTLKKMPAMPLKEVTRLYDIRPPDQKEPKQFRKVLAVFSRRAETFFKHSRYGVAIIVVFFLFTTSVFISALTPMEVKTVRALPATVSGDWLSFSKARTIDLKDIAPSPEFSRLNSTYTYPEFSEVNMSAPVFSTSSYGADDASDEAGGTQTSTDNIGAPSPSISVEFVSTTSRINSPLRGSFWARLFRSLAWKAKAQEESVPPPVTAPASDPPALSPINESAPLSAEPAGETAQTELPSPPAAEQIRPATGPSSETAPQPVSSYESVSGAGAATSSDASAEQPQVIFPDVDGIVPSLNRTMETNEATTSAEQTQTQSGNGQEPKIEVYRVFANKRELKLENFSLSEPLNIDSEVKDIALKLSFMAQGSASSTAEILIKYSTGHDIWNELPALKQDKNYSNYLNNGYVSFALPITGAEIPDLVVKILALANGKPEPIFLDAAWVEVSYVMKGATLDKDKLRERAKHLPRIKILPEKLFSTTSLDFSSTEDATLSLNLKKLKDEMTKKMSADADARSAASLPVPPSQNFSTSSPDFFGSTMATSTLPAPSPADATTTSAFISPPLEIRARVAFHKLFRGNMAFAQAGTSTQNSGADASSSPEILDAVLTDPAGATSTAYSDIISDSDGSRFLLKKPDQTFRPGKYSLTVDVLFSNTIFTTEQNFTWGVLAINTNKSIYTSSEDALLQLASLDDRGRTLCDSSLSLQITSPDGQLTSFSTNDGTIRKSGKCDGNNVVNVPDYSAQYKTEEIGSYKMRLINLDNGHEISDSFEAQENVLFDVERVGPTRIYPPATYAVRLKVKASRDYDGAIVETVPGSFTVSSGNYANVKALGDVKGSKEIIWKAKFSKGEAKEFTYSFKAPDISPEFYLLGPARFIEGGFINDILRLVGQEGRGTVFEEARRWQIAADADSAGDFRSVVTGNWNVAGTWEIYSGTAWASSTTNTPSSSAAGVVTILNGRTVSVTGSVTVDQVVVKSGGTVQHTSNTLTIANGTGTDLQVDSGGTVDVTNQTLTVQAGATMNIDGTFIYGNGSTGATVTMNGTCTISATGIYQHFANAGTVVTCTWSTGSTADFNGVSTNTTAPGGLTQSFYHVIWEMTSVGNKNISNLTTINGNMTINSFSGTLLNWGNTVNTFTIGGNLTFANAANSVQLATTGSTIFNVAGNFTQSGGGEVLMSSGSGDATVNVSGDFSCTAGTINESSSGAGAFVFNKSGTQTYTSGCTITNTINFTVNSGSTLQMAANTTTVNGGGTFTLSAGAALGITSADGIYTSGALGNIRVTGTRTFSAGATYTYNGTSAQNLGNAFPDGANILNINNSAGVTTYSAQTGVSTTLNISANAILTPSSSASVICGKSDGVGSLCGSQGTITGSGTVQVTMASSSSVGDYSNQYVFPTNTLSSLTVEYKGGAAQTISSLTYGGLKINNIFANSTVASGGATTTGTLTLTSGAVVTNGNRFFSSTTSDSAIVHVNGFVTGDLTRAFPTGTTTMTYHLGAGANYTPLQLTLVNVTGAGQLTASTTASDHPDIANSGLDSTKDANRYWTASSSNITFSSYNATTTFVSGDLDAGAATSSFIVALKSGGSWSLPTVGTIGGFTVNATGITGLGDLAVGEASVSTVIISGTLYDDEGVTATTTTTAIKLVVNGGTAYTTSTEPNGTYKFDAVTTPTAAQNITVWMNTNGGETGAAVTRYNSGNITGLDIYKYRLIVRNEDGTALDNSKIAVCTKTLGAVCADTDLHFDVSGGTLTVDKDWRLYLWTGKTFTPGGNVTINTGLASSTPGGDIKFGASSSTLNIAANNLSVGGDWDNSAKGTFTASAGQDTTFNATSTNFSIDVGNNGIQTFQDVVFNGRSNALSSWSFATSTTITGDVTLTLGTLIGGQSITVNGGDVTGNGDINLTNGTFLLDGTGSFGGSTAWDFGALTFGDGSGAASTTDIGSSSYTASGTVTIAASQQLMASSTYIITQTGATPFVISGAFSEASSTFSYRGAGATTVTRTNYYNLDFKPASGSPVLTLAGGGTLQVNGDITVGDGSNAVTVNGSTNDPTLNITHNFTVAASGIFTASDAGTFNVGGNWSVSSSGTFNHSGGTVTFNAGTSGNTIDSGGTGTGKNFANVAFNNSLGGWTIQTNNMTATGTLAVTNIGSFTLASGRTLEVDSTYSVCDTCTSSTTWTGSTLYLNSGSAAGNNYTVGSKTQNAETYATLQIGASTDIKTWKSTASTFTVDTTGSLYSQDHANSTGALNIYGDYHTLNAATDYWRYDTNFDGVALGGSSRQVTVTFANTASTTVDSGGTLDVKGGGGGASQFTNITNNGSGYKLVNNGTTTVFEAQIASSTFAGGTWTLVNTQLTNQSIAAGTLNADWYVGIHVVNKDATSTNIDTGSTDITISESSGSSTVFKLASSSWGSGVASTTTGTGGNGQTPEPNTDAAIRIREYSRTSSATTTYLYNVAITATSTYSAYNYFTDYGSKYISSLSSEAVSGVDKIIGTLWYRDTIATQNADAAVNDPPVRGTLMAGMTSANSLSFTLDSISANLGTLSTGNSFTATTTSVLTISTSAVNGFSMYAFETDLMNNSGTNVNDWPGTNAVPTDWSSTCIATSKCGFGYRTNDADLTQFATSTLYAGFTSSTPGDIVASAAGTVTNDATTITYRMSIDTSKPAGAYATTIIYLLVPVF